MMKPLIPVKKEGGPGMGNPTYNPNYSGGRDQEDCGLKPA
jgi:hypothetical protein